MVRPKIPLISERDVVRHALTILDEEGMEALSIRRLGKELNVNGASLYHHFADKDDILIAVGRAVLREIKVRPPGDDPIAWLIDTAKRQRRVFLDHPNAIPLLSRGYLRTTSLPGYQVGQEQVAKLPISRSGQQLLLRSIEALTVGDVIVALMPDDPSQARSPEVAAELAEQARGAAMERGFEAALRGTIDGVLERYPARAAS